MISDPQLPDKVVQAAHGRESLSPLIHIPSLGLGTHASLSSPCDPIQDCAKQDRAGLLSKVRPAGLGKFPRKFLFPVMGKSRARGQSLTWVFMMALTAASNSSELL